MLKRETKPHHWNPPEGLRPSAKYCLNCDRPNYDHYKGGVCMNSAIDQKKYGGALRALDGSHWELLNGLHIKVEDAFEHPSYGPMFHFMIEVEGEAITGKHDNEDSVNDYVEIPVALDELKQLHEIFGKMIERFSPLARRVEISMECHSCRNQMLQEYREDSDMLMCLTCECVRKPEDHERPTIHWAVAHYRKGNQ